jgi:hypothetical protein
MIEQCNECVAERERSSPNISTFDLASVIMDVEAHRDD